MDFPEDSVVATCGGWSDSSEESALGGIGDCVDCSIVDWNVDRYAEQCFVHPIIAAVATATYRLADRFDCGRGADRDRFLSQQVVTGNVVDVTTRTGFHQSQRGIVEALEKRTSRL